MVANLIRLGAGGHIAERGQRIPVAGPAARGLGRGQADVLTAGHVVITESIRGLSDATDVLDGCVLLPRQQGARRRW